MWCYRKLLKMRCVDKIPRVEVIQRIGEERKLGNVLFIEKTNL